MCVSAVIVLASCGGGNDVASGGTGTGVTSASAVAPAASVASSNTSARTSISPTMAAIDKVGNSFSSVPAGSILRVAYVDAFANTFAGIPTAGFAAPDILIYAFVQSGLTSPVLDSALISAITSAAPK